MLKIPGDRLQGSAFLFMGVIGVLRLLEWLLVARTMRSESAGEGWIGLSEQHVVPPVNVVQLKELPGRDRRGGENLMWRSLGGEVIRFPSDLRASLVSVHVLPGGERGSFMNGGGQAGADKWRIGSKVNFIGRMHSLVDQVQGLAGSRKLDPGGFTWVNLDDILREVVEETRPLARGRRSVVTLLAPSVDRHFVRGEAVSLHWAFARLVSNVICFGVSSSEIILSCNHRNGVLEVSVVNPAPVRCLDKLLDWVSIIRGGWPIRQQLQPGGPGFEIVEAIVDQHGGYVAVKRRGGRIAAVFVGLVCFQVAVGDGS